LKVSQGRWASYSEEKKRQIMEEGSAIYRDIIAAMPQGASSQAVQECIRRWHEHLRYFYEPDKETLLGLADLYNVDPEFNANFRKMHPNLADFMRQAIQIYCAS
jgi:protein-tyrosine-phosphatase